MLFRTNKCVCIALFLAVLTSILGWARAEGVIKGRGYTSIKVKPSAVQVFYSLSGHGPTAKAALADLNRAYDARARQIESLKPDENSISLSAPTSISHAWTAPTASVVLPSAPYPSVAVADPVTTTGPVQPVGPTTWVPAPTYTVPGPPSETHQIIATLTARWSLPSSDPQKVYLFVHGLTENLKKAPAADKEETKKLSPEEQEILEEMESAAGPAAPVATGTSATPGAAFTLVYFGRLPKQQRDLALREAYQRARAEAEAMATAAGVRIGPLASLQEDLQNPSPFRSSHFGVDYHVYQLLRKHEALRQDEPGLAIALSPDELFCPVALVARFKIVE
jgi:hypothetical protein